jgi:hypothetical protein
MKAIKTQKIATFAAHASNATCVKIGTKSGRVVVTGGQDKKVNLWTIGKSNHILVRSFNLESCWSYKLCRLRLTGLA